MIGNAILTSCAYLMYASNSVT